ncbi:SDR family oxidoreductase [Solihabitans fulvus]|uniref:SDR family oxidoreductase n=1 Tax=Solihabitans fulvus TaxID=1892852 RepID=A0A5B2XJS1_9PSEU|nr:SDR family oxidoreductase [Solihabitans fulvus]KAA2263012.1 SDR family oxidoreductase [Solihabitans fulvus]
MTILVTGATGQFGGLAVRHLLDRVPAAELAVSVRDPEKAADLAALGVQVRRGDFSEPESLAETFAGVDKLLLVSTNGPDEQRVAQHVNAIDAAVKAGVRYIAYTSVSDADTSPLELAAVHKATEERLRASGIPFTFLRNGMYHENYTPTLPGAVERGALASAAGEGRIATASRDDLALAAAIVVAGDGHENAIYELTGSTTWSFPELAATVAEITGKPLPHKDVTAEDLTAALLAAGLPDFLAEVIADIQVNIGKGVLSEVRPDLEKLLGRAPSTIEQAARAAFATA